MRQVLIVSPHFPPVNAPDMQRVRLVLPYLRAQGWEPTVLALTADSIEGAVLDPLLETSYPSDIRVVRVRGLSPRFTRRVGIGSLWLRCGRALTRAGDHLLSSERFDVVFFSTTQFSAFTLGPRWLRRFGVPYVIDYQDPWTSDFYARTGARPPGGSLKYAFSHWRARRREPEVLRRASGVISVSPDYGPALARSYPWFKHERVDLLPFGASERDFDIAAAHRPSKPVVDFDDGCFHHVYTGRCGEGMVLAMTALFRGFKKYLRTHPAEAQKTRFHFIGTDYAPPPLGREWVTEIARRESVERYVFEHCYRVPYFDALYYLRNAHAILAIGSNDPTYSASKIFSCVLARRPMLLIYHEDSPALAFARRLEVGTRFGFSSPGDIERLSGQIHGEWLAGTARQAYAPFDPVAFRPFTAGALTAQLARVLARAVEQSGSPGNA